MPKRQYQSKFCRLCQDKVERVDYKDEKRLARFVTEQGKMVPRRVTGTCGRHQRQLAEAIKRARFMALLPYVGRHHRHG